MQNTPTYNNKDKFSRTMMLLGENAMKKLEKARVAVFGVGGVGGFVVEALARSGIGAIDLIDDDTVCPTNLNRQIVATEKTLGRYKVDVAEERIKDINPDCEVLTYKTFYLPETQGLFDMTKYDYVVDAIDTVTGKLTLIENAVKCNTPVISSMGAGNKLDPTAFQVADIYETSICPLAKVMRRECKTRGIKSLKCVYSKEPPIKPSSGENAVEQMQNNNISGTERKGFYRRTVPGSVAFVPSVVGLIIAGEIIKDLVK